MAGETVSVREQVGILFVGVARRWRVALDGGLAEAGLKDVTWSPMVHLSRAGGGLTQTDLAARVGVSGSTLVRVLDALDRRGFIERRQSGVDRRENRLFLTAEGAAVVARIEQRIDALEADMLRDIPDADLHAATALLKRIDANVGARRRRSRRGASPAGGATT